MARCRARGASVAAPRAAGHAAKKAYLRPLATAWGAQRTGSESM